MRVLVSIEQRYDRTPDGKIWTADQNAYATFTRYLDVFEAVRVVGRVRDVAQVPEHYLRADGDQVSFAPLPYYHGLGQYLKQFRQVNTAIRQTVTFEEAIVLNVSSLIADVIVPALKARQFPFGVQVISDPANTFAPGTMRHPLRPLLRRVFVRLLKKHCAAATAASYVTRSYLQQHYPCPGYTVGVSDVVIDDAALVAAPRQPPAAGQPVQLVFVGSLQQLYKAPDILVEAVRQCVAAGHDLRLTMVGDGRYRPEIEAQVQQAGLGGRITFAGNLPGATAVRAELDKAHLFVMPSRAEGMPRAMIEAMARGLPCIGTSIGGIPELLPAEDRVPPDDAPALARKITDFVTQPPRLAAAAQRNLALAREYHVATLRQRRQDFYHFIKERTQAWLS
ncbi:MAG: glycosyltransferase family 4 protein [Anaerolineae bacterium]|jgi:glycosyltransferase involved in cell wall biosynthesis|nr:glycosyltransferase family 4 protein [Anaerolineae bacterium]